MSSVGAGLDSYFEYGLKAAILLGKSAAVHMAVCMASWAGTDALDDDMYLDIWQDTYAALQTHTRTSDGFIVCSSIHQSLYNR